MKKQILTALATAALLAALTPVAIAQNVAIVNGKAVPKARIDALAQQFAALPIDVLLNNAGIGGGGDNQLFTRLNYDVFYEVMAVNAVGPIKVCEAFLKNVQASGQKKMITVSSSQGSIGSVDSPRLYWYRASKSAVNMVMSTWRSS